MSVRLLVGRAGKSWEEEGRVCALFEVAYSEMESKCAVFERGAMSRGGFDLKCTHMVIQSFKGVTTVAASACHSLRRLG
jgi:hypothetical protein